MRGLPAIATRGWRFSRRAQLKPQVRTQSHALSSHTLGKWAACLGDLRPWRQVFKNSVPELQESARRGAVYMHQLYAATDPEVPRTPAHGIPPPPAVCRPIHVMRTSVRVHARAGDGGRAGDWAGHDAGTVGQVCMGGGGGGCRCKCCRVEHKVAGGGAGGQSTRTQIRARARAARPRSRARRLPLAVSRARCGP